MAPKMEMDVDGDAGYITHPSVSKRERSLQIPRAQKLENGDDTKILGINGLVLLGIYRKPW